MNATQKMDAFGLKALELSTGKNLVTLYRWRKALAEGRGISDANKRALIEATAGSAHAIEIGDFFAPPSPPANDPEPTQAASNA